MARSDQANVLDMIHAADLILKYVQGQSLENLRADEQKADAILYRFAILGEAAKRVSVGFREAHPSIDLAGAAGFRDVVIHDYDEVDWEIVLKIVTSDLPALVVQLKLLIVTEPE